MEEKKREALEKLESIEIRLRDLLDNISYVKGNVEDAETAQELWDAICDIEEEIDNSQWVSDEIQEVFDLADDELEEMIAEEDEENEDEEEDEEE